MGKKQGMGQLKLPNGDCYIGEFLRERYHGKVRKDNFNNYRVKLHRLLLKDSIKQFIAVSLEKGKSMDKAYLYL